MRFDTHTYRFSHVLIDDGNNINLLYRSSMENLGIPIVRDITSGIPKYPFILTNIYIIYQVICVGILKSKFAARLGWIIASQAGLTRPRPAYRAAGPTQHIPTRLAGSLTRLGRFSLSPAGPAGESQLGCPASLPCWASAPRPPFTSRRGPVPGWLPQWASAPAGP
jgi:hypothetical protein